MASRIFALHVARLSCAAIAAVLLVGGGLASRASAQVIYEPVQYQYRASQLYYYGGSDPAIHRWAQSPVGGAGRWGRVNGYAFASGDIDRHREVVHEPVRAFTDAMPFINAYIYGFTPTDARNEAYANVPRYFRKGDLLNAAVIVDGVHVVPAQAQPIRIDRNTLRHTRPRAMTNEPRPLMIIPREKLIKPRPQADKSFASAVSASPRPRAN